MVSKRNGEKPTGKLPPASRSCLMGQRPHPMVVKIPTDGRDGGSQVTSQKVIRGKPDIPSDRSGYREERDGSDISRHLRVPAEYIIVNVGGSCGEGCSPPMKRMSVGGPIVVGARESRVQGEGGQGIDDVPVY
jgi:hypothetical protein